MLDLARAHLVGAVLLPLLQEVDFGRLEAAHAAELRQLCAERVERSASAAVTRQMGGRQAIAKIGGELGEFLVQGRKFFALLQDPTVGDILVNGSGRVLAERGGQMRDAGLSFDTRERLLRLAEWLTAATGRPAHTDEPIVETRLQDGSQLSVAMPPVAPDGPVLSIRRRRHLGLDLSALAAAGAFPAELAPLLEAMVASHLNILVCGSVGSGKTSLLNSLVRSVDERDQIATVEQVAELQLGLRRAVRMEAHAAPGGLSSVLASAIRLRPDRLVVGELRGPEARDLLQAMSAGFGGSMTTILGSSVRNSIDNLECMVAQAKNPVGERLIRRQIGRTLDLAIHLRRLGDGRRVVDSITEVGRTEGDTIPLQEVFRLHYHGEGPQGRSVGTFAATGHRPALVQRLEEQGFRLSPELWRLQTAVA